LQKTAAFADTYSDFGWQLSLDERIGLLAEKEDHLHADRRTLANFPWLIHAAFFTPVRVS
jgi:hypothetical protein